METCGKATSGSCAGMGESVHGKRREPANRPLCLGTWAVTELQTAGERADGSLGGTGETRSLQEKMVNPYFLPCTKVNPT